jgi:hypothetical protein
MDERVLNNKVRKVYTRRDVDSWIEYGVDNGYVEKGNKKELYKWLSVLKDLEILL